MVRDSGLKPILAKTHNAHAHFLDCRGPIRIQYLFESTEKNARGKIPFRTIDHLRGMVSFLRTFILRLFQYHELLYLVRGGKEFLEYFTNDNTFLILVLF